MKNLKLNFKSIVHNKARWLVATLLLTLGVGQMWAAEKENTIQNIAKQDTAYIITPNISTQDTIYLKHEDLKPVEKGWWELYGGVLEALLAVLAGAGVSWFTTWYNGMQDQKRKDQEAHYKRREIITEKGIEKEHELYYLLWDIKNAAPEKMTALVDAFPEHLDKAKLDILPPLYYLANDMYVYYRSLVDGEEVRTDEKEQAFFDQYYSTFTEA